MNTRIFKIALVLIITLNVSCKKAEVKLAEFKYADLPKAVNCNSGYDDLLSEALYAFEQDIVNKYDPKTKNKLRAYRAYISNYISNRTALEQTVTPHTKAVYDVLKSKQELINMVYGLGAAVVIIGALFKIMHWPYGNLMLIIGLITEAGVFVVSAFEKPEKSSEGSVPFAEELKSSKEYNEEIEKATLQMKAFSEQASDNRVAAEKLKEQMGQSAKSLSSLNKVYHID